MLIRRLTVWIASFTVALLTMALVLASAAHAQGAPPDAAGQWHGVLATPSGQLRVQLNLLRGPDGTLRGALASPDQTPQPIPLGAVAAGGGRLAFEVPLVHGRYEGAWDAAAGAWKGTWTQTAPLPLAFEKGPLPPPARPQEPAKPYPYQATDVTVASAPGVTLACTFTVPPGKGPFPAVDLITGSGAEDRDEAVFGHKPFLVLADHLTRHGIAVIRCDDRGFAKSTGDFAAATSRDFAVDAEAAAAWLRARPEVDPRHVGLVGHSEGGMIAPMVAVKDPKIAFIVLMAGPGAPARQAMVAQRAAIGAASGVPAAVVAANEKVQAKLDAAVMAAPDTASAQAAAETILAADTPQVPAATRTQQARTLASPWWRFFIAYDPAPTLSQVKVPILALNGGKDVQVVAAVNLPAIRAATKANPDATVVELPGLNHLFQTATTGAPTEYDRITETMSPKALDLMTDWILKRAGR